MKHDCEMGYQDDVWCEFKLSITRTHYELYLVTPGDSYPLAEYDKFYTHINYCPFCGKDSSDLENLLYEKMYKEQYEQNKKMEQDKATPQ